jgi:hypothetical protein
VYYSNIFIFHFTKYNLNSLQLQNTKEANFITNEEVYNFKIDYIGYYLYFVLSREVI